MSTGMNPVDDKPGFNEPLSGEKSLSIIHEMINQAKTTMTDSGLHWIVWGILLFLTSIATFILIELKAEHIFQGWNIFGALTVGMLTLDVFSKPKIKKVRTYMDDLMRYVDIAFIVSMFTIIFSINVAVSPNAGFGYLLMIFAFLMLVKGGAVKSRSLMIGAVVNWAGAIAIFINKEFKYDMLIMAAAVLIGYIIPGILLWSKFKKTKSPE